VSLSPRTLCVHGDTPGALRLLGAIRREITPRP
jgi:lactam utilization protein B